MLVVVIVEVWLRKGCLSCCAFEAGGCGGRGGLPGEDYVAVAGIVKGTVTKASPFALVELTGSAAATEETKTEATKGATTTKTAPKTGEV